MLAYLRGLPDFELAIKGDDYWYASVPLCILDAIFSINARYESVRAAVLRYANHISFPWSVPKACYRRRMNS